MKKNSQDDFLLELLTEELPPKSLLSVSLALAKLLTDALKKSGLTFNGCKSYATPRRLAVLIEGLSAQQPDQMLEKRGPALALAFDAQKNPTQACLGFAKACGVSVSELITLRNDQGEWVGVKQLVTGKTVAEVMPDLVKEALARLPFKKRMRWGESETLFVRPIHSVILLYGDAIIDAKILGVRTGRSTRGHRFMSANAVITIPHAAAYASLLSTEGYVLADFAERRASIVDAAKKLFASQKGCEVFMEADLLNEVTGLVEWPVALAGAFETKYLALPAEVLISSMQDHQRYFPVKDQQGKLLANFVVISNIESHDKKQVITGNERVLRARLADAAFFYEADQKESLDARLEPLKGILFQAQLGTLYDKAERLSQLSAFIAEKMSADAKVAARAGLLAKTDLTTQMVGEFPELQGIMGGYYAALQGEADVLAYAIKCQYMPRFAGDLLPDQPIAQAVSMADKIDLLVGSFGIGQIPTGDKDPYGLRRAAVGVLRIIIEKALAIDLQEILVYARNLYTLQMSDTVIDAILSFMQERLRALCQDQGITMDVFSAVLAVEKSKPFAISQRIAAVQSFKQLPEAEALAIANKRVSNILEQYRDKINAETVAETLFESAEEKQLAAQIANKAKKTQDLLRQQKYAEILHSLAELRKPVDAFFDHVMVMTENKALRENRLLMLTQLRQLFLQVADIALLQ